MILAKLFIQYCQKNILEASWPTGRVEEGGGGRDESGRDRGD